MNGELLTDDEIARLFADADPVTVSDDVLPATLRRPEPDHDRPIAGEPQWRWYLFTAAAVIMLLVLGIVAADRLKPTTPADEPDAGATKLLEEDLTEYTSAPDRPAQRHDGSTSVHHDVPVKPDEVAPSATITAAWADDPLADGDAMEPDEVAPRFAPSATFIATWADDPFVDGDAVEPDEVTPRFAPSATITATWADDPFEDGESAAVLRVWEFDWGLEDCTQRLSTQPSRIVCSTRPTTVFSAVGHDLGSVEISFEIGPDGIESFDGGDIAAELHDALAPFYDWIATERPDAAELVLDDVGSGRRAVMNERTAAAFVELTVDYLARTDSD